jgi:hypothetical protein
MKQVKTHQRQLDPPFSIQMPDTTANMLASVQGYELLQQQPP